MIKSLFRYPGNKKRLCSTILQYIRCDKFWEPFVGGGSLLLAVSQKYPDVELYANDINPSVSDFWDIVSDINSSRVNVLIEEIKNIPKMTLDIWKEIKKSPASALRFIVLNMTSYNGYIHDKTGPIGGQIQEGKKWNVNSLWNPRKIIYHIHEYHRLLSGRLKVENKSLFDSSLWGQEIFIYLDPPYWEQGKYLYAEFGQFDHQKLHQYLSGTKNHWILSYDVHTEVKKLYKDYEIIEVSGFSGAKHEEQIEYLISNRQFVSDQVGLW